MFENKGSLNLEIERLERLGFEEDRHFFVENVYDYELVFEKTVWVRGYEFDSDADLQDRAFVNGKGGDEEFITTPYKEFIGYELIDEDNEVFDINKHKHEALPDVCAICGKSLIVEKWNDKRIEQDGLKCFDHIGVALRWGVVD